MIISSVEAPNFISAVTKLSDGDSFACRILSLYNSYSPDLAFVDYWMTCDEHGACVGAIARNGSNFILFLTEKSDLREISSFLRISGATGILLSGKYELDFAGESSTGVVMKTESPIEISESGSVFVNPDIREAYKLIEKCADKNFTPPAFEDFYVDVNHKLRHGAMRLCGLVEGGELAAIAMTVAESGDGAVLGAVACAPEYRRQGCGSRIVCHIVNQLVSENKTVFLNRAENANAGFYNRLGFEECGSWREYKG